jgi:hypothetical protein
MTNSASSVTNLPPFLLRRIGGDDSYALGKNCQPDLVIKLTALGENVVDEN